MPFNAQPGLLREVLRSTRGVWIALLALVAIGTFWNIPARTGEPAVALPAPAIDNPRAAGPLQTAVIAGGCFWGVQGVFQHTKGVKQALSGYSGGEKSTADYEKVGSGRTGHAESVQIVFDPKEISYGDILGFIFRSRTIRPSSTARGPMSARSTALRFFTATRRSSASRRPISTNCRRRGRSPGPSSRASIRSRDSIPPKPITRTFWFTTRLIRTS